MFEQTPVLYNVLGTLLGVTGKEVSKTDTVPTHEAFRSEGE